MTTRSVTVVAAGAILALLAACAQPAPSGDSGDPGGSPSSPSPPMPSVGPSTTPAEPTPSMPAPVTPKPSATHTKPSAERTVTGEVVEGVEMNCLLLRTESGDELLLVSRHDELRIGATVTVRGHAEPGMMSTCQQGTPFVVDEVVSP